jgi:excisionase family DNA binding protein
MIYTTAEAAEVLKLKPDTVRSMIVTARLQGVNLAPPGKRPQWRIEQAALDEFLARGSTSKAEKRKPRRVDPIPFRRYSA